MDFEEVKKHPYLIGGVIVGGALFLYLILHRGGGAAASGGSDMSALYGAEIQAGEQQSQLGAQLQAAQLQANSTSQANTLTAGVDLAQIAATKGSTDLQTTTAGDVQELSLNNQLQAAQYALEGQITASNNALAGLQASDATQVNIAGINANQNETIAQLTNQTSQDYINATTNALITNSNNNRDITITALKQQGGGGGGIFGAIGAVAGIAAAFL